MDDVSLSHSEIDFICNKIRGEAVTFSNYTGIFLIQQQYGKNCITDIPIFRPFEFFSLVFPELVVASRDFFSSKMLQKNTKEVLLLSTSNVRFLQKMNVCFLFAEGTFLKRSIFY